MRVVLPRSGAKRTFTADVAATTQPTSQPASNREVVLQRRTEATDLPTTTTTPATTQATTQTATQPAADLSTWVLVSDPTGEASDEKVKAILNGLHPLQAQSYLKAAPATQATPVATYTINLTTEAPGGTNVQQHQIRFTDRGNDQPLVGEYNGLIFELDRAILRQLEGEFTKGVRTCGPRIPHRRK